MSSSALQDSLPSNERVVDLVLTAAYAITGRWIEEYDLWDESRAKALLDIFGVRELADRNYGTLSEGERKRVQIARSLMADPEILLLDEPFAALDVMTIKNLQNIIVELQREAGISIILCDHQARDLLACVDTAAIINNGKVVAQGTPSNLSKDIEAKKAYFGDSFKFN